MKRLLMLALLAVALAPLGGCVVAPAPVYHAHWVPGHYGPYGGWHPSHWN